MQHQIRCYITLWQAFATVGRAHASATTSLVTAQLLIIYILSTLHEYSIAGSFAESPELFSYLAIVNVYVAEHQNDRCNEFLHHNYDISETALFVYIIITSEGTWVYIPSHEKKTLDKLCPWGLYFVLGLLMSPRL